MTERRSPFERYGALLDAAERRFARGDRAASVALLQIAARYAYPAAAGLFASPRLERLLVAIGRSLDSETEGAPPNVAGRGQQVLHVLSYARPVGGDTRFVWRWIEEDAGSTHSVAVTTQGDIDAMHAVPTALVDAVAASGGSLHLLQAPTSRPLDQALELRRLCRCADIVVLHLFPYDVIPVLALCHGVEAKTVFVDHSDHTFWAGASVAHAVVHLRTQSAAFLRRRRNLKPATTVVLPIPLAFSSPAVTREAAMTALGYDRDAVVLLTIASPFKYSSPGRDGLLDLVVPVLRELPQAVLVAVGPTPDGAWLEANRLTGGRVIALGQRHDNALLYAAADVYLDSVPFSSITSLLEAGSAGAPLLGLIPPDADLALLGPGAPGLDGTMDMAPDATSYRQRLRRLVVDADHRTARGRGVREKVLALHTGPQWREAVGAVYADVCGAGERDCFADEDDAFEATALNRALDALYPGGDEPAAIRRMLWRFLRPLPYRTRMSIVWHLYRRGFGLSVPNLLPTSWNLLARSGLRRARSVFVARAATARRPAVALGPLANKR